MNRSRQHGGALAVTIVIVVIAVILVAVGSLVWMMIPKPVRMAQTQQTTTQTQTAKPDSLIQYDPPIQVTTSADLAKLTGAPNTLKTYVMDRINKDNAAIKGNNAACYRVMTIDKISQQVFAVGGFATVGNDDCNNSTGMVLAFVNNEWVQVATSQDHAFSCASLEMYGVPAEIAGSTCFDEQVPGGERAYE